MRRYKEYCVIENVLVPKVPNSKDSYIRITLVLHLSSNYLDRRLVEQVNRTLLIVRSSYKNVDFSITIYDFCYCTMVIITGWRLGWPHFADDCASRNRNSKCYVECRKTGILVFLYCVLTTIRLFGLGKT